MSAKDDREVRRVGIEWAHRQSVGLMEAGYLHLHYYIMQNTTPFVELMHLLRVQA
jgi:5,10-methylenetetrahydrofolate reductase